MKNYKVLVFRCYCIIDLVKYVAAHCIVLVIKYIHVHLAQIVVNVWGHGLVIYYDRYFV